MKLIKRIFRFFFSRALWVLIGILLLCWLVWSFGGIVEIGGVAPLGSELARLIAVGVILLLWLFNLLFRQIRALKANQVFVSELAQVEAAPAPLVGEENIAEVQAKFKGILEEMKRSKVGGKSFLREMPWYVIIGPPGAGKTTALRQSGLHFPIDLSDDLHGVGGTRNCDWFFAEDAVLIDTAGRYVQQESQPDVDAAEWLGFLDLLKKHRGRRALNGVLLAISVEELSGDTESVRAHGREIRKRLSELQQKLEIRLPVYLMITKSDLIPGFEAFFDDLGVEDREKVWGATFPTDVRIDGNAVQRELQALAQQIDKRTVGRVAESDDLAERASAFRFPTQFESFGAPIRVLIDTVFGESKYEEAAWLRGFYLTSATQEGSPIDRLMGSLAGSFGLRSAPVQATGRVERRSFFIRDLFEKIIFQEAGLGTFDKASVERRKWLWRGSAALAVGASLIGGLIFTLSYFQSRGEIRDQVAGFERLQSTLVDVAARQTPLDPLDLDVALQAVNEVAASGVQGASGLLSLTGPTATAEVARSSQLSYDQALRNILEPRMVALLEVTMRQNARDPEFLLGALKVYQMMTGLTPIDTDFAQGWWAEELPGYAPIDAFPTEAAFNHQIAAIDRMAIDPNKVAHDPVLVASAVSTICEVPLAVRAYRALLAEVAGTKPADWLPGEHAGPNGSRIFTRISGKTLRVGLDGVYTFDGFHEAIMPNLPDIAAQAALDRTVFSGGCAESAQVSAELLEQDILKLYYEDFIAQWDGLLRDITLAPIEDLPTANANLKDLSSADSALKRLIVAVVRETHLTRSEEETAASGPPPGVLKKAAAKLGKVGKILKRGKKLVPKAGGAAGATFEPGQPVASHFQPLRGVVEEIDGIPPLLGDTVLALTALANELQTVSASPDPNAALLSRGGLPELTGAISNQARTLPDPIDDWLVGIAGDVSGTTREAVIGQLTARWRADVLSFCTAATQGRYPFEKSSSIDVNLDDFARLFGPGQLIDTFIKDLLLEYVDTAQRPWAWRADFGVSNEVLAPFEQARSIRDGLFPGGAGPIMAFALTPVDLSPNASRITLDVDGQQLAYFNAAARPVPMQWPTQNGTNMITLSFAPIEGGPEVLSSETGNWAILRLFEKGRVQATSLPELFKLRLSKSGYTADFDLRANSVDNPFNLTMFDNFACPDGF